MDKTLIDILEEEKERVYEILELNEAIAKAETKSKRMYELWTLHEGDDIIPYIEVVDAEIKAMKMKQQVQVHELTYIHKMITDSVIEMANLSNSEYLNPVKINPITTEKAKQILEAGMDRMNNVHVRRGGVTRKGRVSYGKVNQVQN